jgi:hypothetical protein
VCFRGFFVCPFACLPASHCDPSFGTVAASSNAARQLPCRALCPTAAPKRGSSFAEEISDQELESIPAAPSRQSKPWSRILSSRIAPNGLRVRDSPLAHSGLGPIPTYPFPLRLWMSVSLVGSPRTERECVVHTTCSLSSPAPALPRRPAPPHPPVPLPSLPSIGARMRAFAYSCAD